MPHVGANFKVVSGPAPRACGDGASIPRNRRFKEGHPRVANASYLKLTDYEKAVEVADEYVRQAPANHNARYLRGVAFEGVKDFRRALVDLADTIELSSDKKAVGSQVFLRMAGAYAALGQFCEAAAPINM
jgi:tetratricopeptide (TPR) repeat protein